VINLGATSGTANATLTYGASTSDSTDRTIILGDTSGSKTIQTSGTGNLTLNGTITRGTNNLELGAGNALSTLRVESQLGGSGALTKTGDGTLTLTSATSDFTGEIRVNGGTLEFTSIANIGVASSLGNGSATSIRVGNAANSGTLNYVGDGDATDRQIRIGAGSGLGNATVNNNGANGGTGLQFTNASFNVSTANATAGSRTLTLGGTNTDANEISGAIVDNTGAGAMVNLTKADAGKWILSGTNTFTGATVVSGGTLELKTPLSPALGNTASVAVTNATLLVSTSNQVRDGAAVSLSGGTIQRGSGVSETMGNLSVTASSILNYGTGDAGTLQFGTYSASGGSILTLNNFGLDNVIRFVGTDLRLLIDPSYTGNSFSYAGTAFSNSNFAINNMPGGFFSTWNSGTSTFTITAVPEPSTVLAAFGLAGLMLWPMRRYLVRAGSTH
jgi:fibronectin-binding autotransporter adhesin